MWPYDQFSGYGGSFGQPMGTWGSPYGGYGSSYGGYGSPYGGYGTGGGMRAYGGGMPPMSPSNFMASQGGGVRAYGGGMPPLQMGGASPWSANPYGQFGNGMSMASSFGGFAPAPGFQAPQMGGPTIGRGTAPQGTGGAGGVQGYDGSRTPTMAVAGTGGPRMVNGMEVGSQEWMDWAGIKPSQMNAAHGGVAAGPFGAPSNFQSSDPEWGKIKNAWDTGGEYYIPQGNEAYSDGGKFLVPASGTDQGLFKDVNSNQVYNWGQQQGGGWGWTPWTKGATPTGQNGMFLRPGEGGSAAAPGRVMQRLF